MIRRLCQLVCASFLAWGALAYPVWLYGGNRSLVQSGVAAGVCVFPAALTLALGLRLSRGTPEQFLVLIIGGMAVRLVMVFGVGAALAKMATEFRGTGFWLWVLLYYLVTLVLEALLLVRTMTPGPRRLGSRMTSEGRIC